MAISTQDLFEFSLRIPGGSSCFTEEVIANNRPLAELTLKAKYGAGLSILTCRILRRVS